MAVRGLRSYIDELVSASSEEGMSQPKKERLQTLRGEEAGTQQKIFELQSDIKTGGERIAEKERETGTLERKAREKYAANVRGIYESPDYDTTISNFNPTRTTGSDLMGLFSMLSATAFMSGGEGRYAGLAAMGNMGAALEGWNKGRQDLFKRELQEFDKNLKTVDQHNKMVEAKLKKALDLFTVDREASMGLVAEVKADVAGTKAQQELNKGLLTQALDTLKQTRSSTDKMLDDWRTLTFKAFEEKQRSDREIAAKMVESGKAKEILQGSDGNIYFVTNDGKIKQAGGINVPKGVTFKPMKGGGASGSGGAVQFRYNAAMTNAGVNLALEISNVASLPATATPPQLANVLTDPNAGITDAAVRFLSQKITEPEDRAMQQMLAGMSRAITTIEQSGRPSGITEGAIKEFSKQMPKAGDNKINLYLYLAQGKQVMNILIKDLQANGGSEAQLSVAEEARQQVESVIPWNVSDINRILTGTGPRLVDDKLKNALQSSQNIQQFESLSANLPQAPSAQRSATQPQNSQYTMGQIITKGNKRYRVTGLSDPNDPDVEEVK